MTTYEKCINYECGAPLMIFKECVSELEMHKITMHAPKIAFRSFFNEKKYCTYLYIMSIYRLFILYSKKKCSMDTVNIQCINIE